MGVKGTGYRYNVYDHGVLIMKNAAAEEIAATINVPIKVPSTYSITDRIYKDRYKFDSVNEDYVADRGFKTKFGINPDDYDRAMREFREKYGESLKGIYFVLQK